MKEKRELIKPFQVCALIESNPSMVRKDDIVRWALDMWKNVTVKRTLLLILYQRRMWTCKVITGKHLLRHQRPSKVIITTDYYHLPCIIIIPQCSLSYFLFITMTSWIKVNFQIYYIELVYLCICVRQHGTVKQWERPWLVLLWVCC